MPATKRQLLQTKRILKQAHSLILDAHSTFHSVGDGDTAERLRDVADNVLLELEYLDRLILVLP